VLQEACAALTAAGDDDTTLKLAEPARAPGMGLDQFGPRLGEGATMAEWGGAVEPPRLDAQARSRCGDRQVG